jgi:amino acid transporter, AAT family
MTTVAVLVCTEILWSGAPRHRSGATASAPLRGIVVMAGSVLAGIALFALALRGMSAFWGEAFQGGQYTDAPYFRHLHAAELAGFFILSAFALDTFLGRPATLPQRALWTLLAAIATAALHVFYYSPLADRLLGKVPGFAQPEDTPLVWTLLVLTLVLVQRDFFAGWPLRRRPDVT